MYVSYSRIAQYTGTLFFISAVPLMGLVREELPAITAKAHQVL